MSKERLSKLQKWILMAAFKNEGALYRRDIPLHYFGKRTPSAQISTTRAVWNLIKKGLVEGHGPYHLSGEQLMVEWALTWPEDAKITDEQLREHANTIPVRGKTYRVINDQAVATSSEGGRVRNKEIYLTPRGEKIAKELLNAKSGINNKAERGVNL